MALNWSGGAQGALSGGIAGASTGNPWVAGGGALLGGAAGLFGGGGNSNSERSRNLKRYRAANARPIDAANYGAGFANYGGATPTYAPVTLDPADRNLKPGSPEWQTAVLAKQQQAVAAQGARQREQLLADTLSGYRGVADTAGTAQDQSIAGLRQNYNDLYGMQDRFGASRRDALASDYAQREALRAQNAARRGLNFQESDRDALAGRRQLASTALEDQLLQARIAQRMAGGNALYGAEQQRIGQQAQLQSATPNYLSQLDLGFVTPQDAQNTLLQRIGIQQQNKALKAAEKGYQAQNQQSFMNSLLGAGAQIGGAYYGNRQPKVVQSTSPDFGAVSGSGTPIRTSMFS